MSLSIERIQALCFDVDGTLSDTDNHLVERIARVFNPIHRLFPSVDSKSLARRIVMASESPGNFILGIPDIFGFDGMLYKLSDLVYRIGIRANYADIQPIPGIIENIQHLSHHYPMAIVSNRGARSTNIFLDKFDLTGAFRCIATAQTCKYSKPYPDPVLWAADQMGISPTSCLMIGDTTIDIRAGKSAGAQTVGVLCGFGEVDELTRVGADLILNSTSDLPEILLEGTK